MASASSDVSEAAEVFLEVEELSALCTKALQTLGYTKEEAEIKTDVRPRHQRLARTGAESVLSRIFTWPVCLDKAAVCPHPACR